jgi:nucleotide-binding universal stress UspA family protein
MRTIRKILCPTDFSALAGNAARYAWQLADTMKAELLLLNVVFPDTESLDMPAAVLSATRRKLDDAEQLLARAEEELRKNGGEVTVARWVEIGAAAPIIAQVAEREGVDLIVIGARGGGQSLHRLLGSNTLDVVKLSKVPVWIVPEYAAFRPIDTLLFATDLDKATPFHLWEVSRMLKPYGQVVRCAHVARPADTNHADMTLRDLEAFFADFAPGLQLSFHELADTDIANGIQDAAFNLDADLIVMIRPQRSWMERLLHHSETLTLARQAEIPLLVAPA